ncbi:MAG: hypothetical protein IPM29_04595 [Planctomycetes bacterium]|nr:hypothetical protein [Planctomycetota bacterium]
MARLKAVEEEDLWRWTRPGRLLSENDQDVASGLVESYRRCLSQLEQLVTDYAQYPAVKLLAARFLAVLDQPEDAVRLCSEILRMDRALPHERALAADAIDRANRSRRQSGLPLWEYSPTIWSTRQLSETFLVVLRQYFVTMRAMGLGLLALQDLVEGTEVRHAPGDAMLLPDLRLKFNDGLAELVGEIEQRVGLVPPRASRRG